MFLARLKRRIFKYHTFWRYAFTASLFGLFMVILVFFLLPGTRLIWNVLSGPINVFSFVSPQKVELDNSNGRTNILLLGIGGGNHDGPNLTDSIMVASISQEASPSTILISLPRDIYLDSLENKINSAYDTGKTKRNGGGLILAKSAVSEVTGLPIHYAFVVDFSGFEKAIDLLGGIDVNVENSFDDFQYPITGKENDLCGLEQGQPEETYICRYEHLHFDAGPAHFTGNQALQFVRSRHAQGLEGSDFARARRQQLVIEAVKNKVFSASTLLQPSKLNDIFETFKANIDTDLSREQLGELAKMAILKKNSKIETYVLSQDLFDNPPIDQRGWILVPKDGNFNQIHQLLNQKVFQTNPQGNEKQN